MDPTTWAWIAMIVGAGTATLLLARSWHAPRHHLIAPAIAVTCSGVVLASAGAALVDGWRPWGAAALVAGVVVAALAELAADAAAMGQESRPDAVAGRLTVGMMGLGLFVVAAVHLLMTEVLASGDALVVLAALAVGTGASGAVWRIATIGGGVPRLPASELVALVVAAPVAAALVSAGDRAAVALALGVESLGVVAASASLLAVRRGDRAIVLRRRTLVTVGVVIVGGAAVALTLEGEVRGVDHWRWLAGAVPLGAVLTLAVGQVMEWFTSDRWRSAKRAATRARAGAAAVITSGVGDAARATGWLLGVLGVALVAAERLGRQAGDGVLAMVLMVTGAVATLGAGGAGLAFSALVRRAGAPAADATSAQREAAEARAASASAAAAVARGGLVVSAALSGFALLLALGRAAGLAAEPPGVWTLLGGIGGVAAAWYAVGWSSHLGEPPPGPHRSASSLPTAGAVLRRTVITTAMGIVPVGLGWFDPEALWVLLAGVLAAGTGLALAMVVAAGSWENVRALIETGAHGGPTSRAHRAVVAADTLGERWREVAAPTVMALVGFAVTVAVASAPLLD